MLYFSFSFWLTLLNIIIPRSTHVAANGIISFFVWPSNVLLCVYTHTTSSMSIYLLMDTGFFHVSAVTNNASVNIGMHVSFLITLLSGYMPRNGIAGSYSNSIFSFLRNFHIVYHSDCINLHSHKYNLHEGSLSTTLSPAFPTWILSNDVHSDQCEMVSHFIFDLQFPITSGDEYLFMYLWVICRSFEKYLVRSPAHFLIALFAFFVFELYELFVYFGN